MTTSNTPLVWALIDPQAGTGAQCLGVAEKTGWPFVAKPLKYRFWAKLPNQLLGASVCGIDEGSRASLVAPWPDIVISAGRRTAPVARWIKRKNPNVKLAHIMWPGAAAGAFDLIALPAHDRKHGHSHILRTMLAPHRLTKAILQQEAAKWEAKFAHLPRPYTALLLGGVLGRDMLTQHELEEWWQQLEPYVREGSLLISTSRRTPLNMADFFADKLSTPHAFYRWKPENENPYRAFLGLADRFVVTGDSVSMVSETCFTGKPVAVLQPATLPKKHQRFLEALAHQQMITRLADAPATHATSTAIFSYQQDAAAQVAEAVKALSLDFR